MKNKYSAIIICILLLLYSVIKNIFNLTSLTNYNLIINPLVCFGIFIFALFIFDGINENIRDKNNKQKTIFILSAIYLIIFFALGLIFTFEYNALSLKLMAIIKNIISFVLVIVILEMIRMLILNNVPKKKLLYLFIIIAFTAVELNINVQNFDNFDNIFKFVLGSLMPMVVKQSVFTYISLKYGCTATLINRVLIQLAFILTPILPKFEWFILATIDIVYYYILYLIIHYEDKLLARTESKRKSKKANPLANVIIILLIFMAILFQAGMFNYTPIAIVSDSMKPSFSRGDAVVVKKITASDIDNLKVGDVIEYAYNNYIIFHRIIAIYDINGSKYIKTKGDNNSDPDFEYVTEDQILGIAKFTIPYIGYPTAILNDLVNKDDKPKIEMGN